MARAGVLRIFVKMADLRTSSSAPMPCKEIATTSGSQAAITRKACPTASVPARVWRANRSGAVVEANTSENCMDNDFPMHLRQTAPATIPLTLPFGFLSAVWRPSARASLMPSGASALTKASDMSQSMSQAASSSSKTFGPGAGQIGSRSSPSGVDRAAKFGPIQLEMRSGPTIQHLLRDGRGQLRRTKVGISELR